MLHVSDTFVTPLTWKLLLPALGELEVLDPVWPLLEDEDEDADELLPALPACPVT